MWWNKGENYRNAWDYEFDWTPDHLTKEQFEPLAYTYDELATECLDILDEISPPQRPDHQQDDASSTSSSITESQSSTDSTRTDTSTSSSSSSSTTSQPNPSPSRDYYTLLKQHHHLDPKLSHLWTQLTTLPPWATPQQLARGQTVFYRYAGPALAGLTFQSLLGGMGGYRVVETLSRTGGFTIHTARRRLLETFQHVLDVTQDISSLNPDGAGFVSSVRVRFLHANVRRRVLALAKKSQEGYYDVQRYGVPINDLDSIGTIAAFSATLLWVSFPRQGIWLTEQERVDYITLWRYIAYLLGTPDEYFATPALAKATMESLMLTEIDPTDTSRILANNIIAALADQPPGYVSRDFLRAESWWLNGPKLSQALGVPRPGVWYKMLVGMQCVAFMGIIYVTRAVPRWDARRIERLRVNLRKITVALAGGRAAEHGFQYTPAMGRMTRGEEVVERKGFEVEKPYQKTLVVGGAIVAAAAWLGLRFAWGVFLKD